MRKLIYLLLLTMPLASQAQKEGNVWYFGLHAGLDFNSGSPVAIPNSSIATNEGCASIADTSGNLLFYTTGDSAWDKTGHVMPNGFGLGGSTTTTQTLIVPQPGSSTLYYLFTADQQGGGGISGGFNFNIVDMSLNGGLGDVVLKDSMLYDTTTEKMCATVACNDTDIWIVSHKWNSDAFYTYLLDKNGLSGPVISHAGMVHADMGSGSGAEAIGYMKFSPDRKKIALVSAGHSNTLQVLDFDIANGTVSANNTITDTRYPVVPKSDGTYGVSFSPDNSKLYVTYVTSSTDLYQYNMQAGDSTAIIASRVLITTTTGIKLGALQNGPDGKMYVAKTFSHFLDVINKPNEAGAACNFTTDAISLGKTPQATYGLPDVMEHYFSAPHTLSFTYNSCLGNKTLLFTDSVLKGNVAPLWSFDDAASGTSDTSTLVGPFHTFLTPGVHSIKLILSNHCKTDTLIKLITADSTNVALTINPSSPSVCVGQGITLTASGGTTYTWIPTRGLNASTGSTVIAHPSATTTFTITATNSNGCTAMTTDTFTVLPAPTVSFNYIINGLQVSFTPDSATGDVNTYSWDFGDTTALNSDEHPSYTYTTKRVFNVCLTVYNNSNCSYTICKNVDLVNNDVESLDALTGMQLWPNPAGRIITLTGNMAKGSTMHVLNVLGQTLLTQNNLSATNKTNIDVSQLIPGVYLLKIESNNQTAVLRFVKK